MAHKYLKQRDSMLHVRKRVPLDLIPLLGQTEIHCSLRTGDQRQAKDLARTILTNLETGFLTLRQQRLLNMPKENLREAAQRLICDRLPSLAVPVHDLPLYDSRQALLAPDPSPSRS